MLFKPMDPALAAKLAEGYTNELEPQRKALDVFYRTCRCPACGSACEKRSSVAHAFGDPDTLVPRALLRCTHCALEFDPHSGIVLSTGRRLAPPPDGF